jgi:hypothetical protein
MQQEPILRIGTTVELDPKHTGTVTKINNGTVEITDPKGKVFTVSFSTIERAV